MLTAASPMAIALARFGLGARPDEPAPADPRRWLIEQFDRFEPRPAAFAAIPTRREVAERLVDYYAEQRQNRANPPPMPAATPSAPTLTVPAVPATPAPPAAVANPARRDARQDLRAAYLAMVGARVDAALTTPAPFAERLAHFWANHFAISVEKLPVLGLGGLLEVEAIRPNLTGRFHDMLVAVETHPAMLLYLDQAQSIGPESPVGQFLAGRAPTRRRAGLNENLAREILELHTLGVGGGYHQADVTEFARALTGWTVNGISQAPAARRLGLDGPAGEFAFAAPMHQPGAVTIMGRRYAQDGQAQARAILSDLASHPATANHLATKLARHFAGSTPPPALVRALATRYRETDGDLAALYRVLVASEACWQPAPTRFRTPWEWSLAAMRAVGTRSLGGQTASGLLDQLGQPVWRPGSPAGWDDTDASWAAPDAVLRRVEAANRIAARTPGLDARALAATVLPGALGPATRDAIARADNPAQALALFLVSPEMMRR